MAIATVTDLVKAVRTFRLLEAHQQGPLAQLQMQFAEPRTLARKMQDNGWLTAYQARQLLDHGPNAELQFGPYVILDKLGEGGMGQVFKARNWKLDRLVALKIIRKERLHNADVVQRFRREIRAAAQLDHANVVLAYDADEVNGTHFYAMEYVDGVDLARRVRESGPLPIDEAVDYVRQTALGLQHAFERGLVHRDIKPANLMVSKAHGLQPVGLGALKILDMGLARLSPLADESSTLVTHEGTMMGTPDFVAPEQMIDSHQVDIRADLYSLGCTFYFLLTGQVPFPGGGFGEKLVKHQLQQPVPVEHLRPDVPPAVALIVRTLMAKHPEERYQTPAELATVLTSIMLPASTRQALARALVSSVAPPPPVVGPENPVLDAKPATTDTHIGHTSVVERRRCEPPSTAVGEPSATRKRGLVLAGCALVSGIVLVPVAVLMTLHAVDEPRQPTPPATVSTQPNTIAVPPTAMAPRAAVYLSDLPEVDVSVGWGEFGKKGELNFPNDPYFGGKRIAVQGIEAPNGLSLHPPPNGSAHVSYALNKQYQEFHANVAINDTAGKGSVGPQVFRVWGDGVVLWQSIPMQRCGRSQPCVVPITGVHWLKLEVEALGSNGHAHAVWVDPFVR